MLEYTICVDRDRARGEGDEIPCGIKFNGISCHLKLNASYGMSNDVTLSDDIFLWLKW